MRSPQLTADNGAAHVRAGSDKAHGFAYFYNPPRSTVQKDKVIEVTLWLSANEYSCIKGGSVITLNGIMYYPKVVSAYDHLGGKVCAVLNLTKVK